VLKKNILIICLAFAFLFSCKIKQPTHEFTLSEYPENGITPGSIKIADNIYIDLAETSNSGYLEFLYYTRRVIGEEEYKSIMPDTDSWRALIGYKGAYAMSEYYLRHPAYRNYPVIGISYQQALKFCKWRADRVMEFILIQNNIIPYNISPPKDSVFTIKKYFSGNYYNIKPSPYIKYYPVYNLPDSAIFMKALKVSDSLYSKNAKYYKSAKHKDALEVRCLETIPNRCDTLPYGLDPTKNNPDKIYEKRKLIVDLLGNVRELTSDSTKAFGGSFFDSCIIVNSKYFYPAYPKITQTNKGAYLNPKGISLLTGFRCVCSWKKWE